MEEFPRTRTHSIEKSLNGSVLKRAHKLGGISLSFETEEEFRIFGSLEHIPQLFPAESVVALAGNHIVRMNPKRHSALAGDSFDLHGELASIHLIDAVSDHPVKISVHHFAYGIGCKPTVFDKAVAVAQICKYELVLAPDIFVKYAAEAQRIQFSFFCHSTSRGSGQYRYNKAG